MTSFPSNLIGQNRLFVHVAAGNVLLEDFAPVKRGGARMFALHLVATSGTIAASNATAPSSIGLGAAGTVRY